MLRNRTEDKNKEHRKYTKLNTTQRTRTNKLPGLCCTSKIEVGLF